MQGLQLCHIQDGQGAESPSDTHRNMAGQGVAQELEKPYKAHTGTGVLGQPSPGRGLNSSANTRV